MFDTERPIEEVVDELRTVQRRATKLQNELAERTAIAWAVIAWPARARGDVIIPISTNYKSYAAPNGCDPEVVIWTYVDRSVDDVELLRYCAGLCACDNSIDIGTKHWSKLQTVLIRVFDTKDEAIEAERRGDAHNNPQGRWSNPDDNQSSQDRW